MAMALMHRQCRSCRYRRGINIKSCNALERDGRWIIFNEGGQRIFDDTPIIWARWPTHDGSIDI